MKLMNLKSVDNHVVNKQTLDIPVSTIWPTNDENKDRIQSQLQFGQILATYIRAHNLSYENKVVLVATDGLYEPIVSGDQLFRENCPIANCSLTTDIKKFRRTANAVILVRLPPNTIKALKPKPRKQVYLLHATYSSYCSRI